MTQIVTNACFCQQIWLKTFLSEIGCWYSYIMACPASKHCCSSLLKCWYRVYQVYTKTWVPSVPTQVLENIGGRTGKWMNYLFCPLYCQHACTTSYHPWLAYCFWDDCENCYKTYTLWCSSTDLSQWSLKCPDKRNDQSACVKQAVWKCVSHFLS